MTRASIDNARRRRSAVCLIRLFLWAEVEATDELQDEGLASTLRTCKDDLMAQFDISPDELFGKLTIEES